MSKGYAPLILSSKSFQLNLELLSLDIQRVLASQIGENHLLFLHYIIVDSFEVDNSNKKPIFNIFHESYVLPQCFLNRYIIFGRLTHLQSQALYFFYSIIKLL